MNNNELLIWLFVVPAVFVITFITSMFSNDALEYKAYDVTMWIIGIAFVVYPIVCIVY